jgi:hypothetical protein
MPPFPTKRMLGFDFFVGTAAEAIAHVSKYGGLIVAPKYQKSEIRDQML